MQRHLARLRRELRPVAQSPEVAAVAQARRARCPFFARLRDADGARELADRPGRSRGRRRRSRSSPLSNTSSGCAIRPQVAFAHPLEILADAHHAVRIVPDEVGVDQPARDGRRLGGAQPAPSMTAATSSTRRSARTRRMAHAGRAMSRQSRATPIIAAGVAAARRVGVPAVRLSDFVGRYASVELHARCNRAIVKPRPRGTLDAWLESSAGERPSAKPRRLSCGPWFPRTLRASARAAARRWPPRRVLDRPGPAPRRRRRCRREPPRSKHAEAAAETSIDAERLYAALVRVQTVAVPNARSNTTLGREREGTGHGHQQGRPDPHDRLPGRRGGAKSR